MPDNPPADLDLDMSRFLLTQVGDQFCDLLEQEKEAISVHMSDGKFLYQVCIDLYEIISNKN